MSDQTSPPSEPLPEELLDLCAPGALRHVLLPARCPKAGSEQDYQRAYAFWHKSWQSTFREVNAGVELHSDVFVMQSELSALFRDDQPIALMLHDFRDLRFQAHRDLSYFKHYPADTLEALRAQDHCDVMMAGQLSVHPDYRRRRIGPFVADTLVGLSLQRFMASAASVMLGFTRNDRKAQEMAYRFGATALRQGHEAYGIDCDVVAFYRDRVCESPLPHIAQTVERLWGESNRSHLTPGLPSMLRVRAADNAQDHSPQERLEHG